MSDPVIISFGGGKGGTGKSTITVNIGTMLAERGHRVGFLDADLGGANLHTMLGVQRPRLTLSDFLSRRADLSAIASPTVVENTWLISGASDVLELANPRFAQKQQIITALKHLDADYLLIDLGAGAGAHSTDFFAAFPIGVLVLDGLPTSVENAYGFLKNTVIRGIARLFPAGHEVHALLLRFADPLSEGGIPTITELIRESGRISGSAAGSIRDWLSSRRYAIVLNMVRDQADIAGGPRFTDIVRKYLGLNCIYAGYLIFDPLARDAVRSMQPLARICSEQTRACLEALCDNVYALSGNQ